MRASSLLFVLVAPLAAEVAAQDQPQSQPTYVGRAFIFQADVPKARALGWLDSETSDAEALENVAAGLLKRVRSMGRFPEAQVAQEEGGRFSVTFVGKMADNMERFLEGGLASSGRLSLRVVAEDSDLSAHGTSMAAERQRMESWLAAHGDDSLNDFNLLPAEEGGPHPSIHWMPRLRFERDSVRQTAPVAVLDGDSLRFQFADLTGTPRLKTNDRGEMLGFMLELAEVPAQALHGFEQAHPGRVLAFAVNDHVAATEPVPEESRNQVFVDAPMEIADYRELLLGFAGGALDVPLTFVEHGKRPLPRRRAAGHRPRAVRRRAEEARRARPRQVAGPRRAPLTVG